MRITKEIAKNAAFKAFEKSLKELNKKAQSYNDTLYEAYLSLLPTKIIECLKEHPEYFKKTYTIATNSSYGSPKFYDTYSCFCILDKLISFDLKKEYVTLGSYPYDRLDSTKLEDVDSTYIPILNKEYSEFEKYKNKVTDSITELYETLYGLRTLKKVLEVLPDMEKYLPKEEKKVNLPAVVNPKLVNAIKNQPL